VTQAEIDRRRRITARLAFQRLGQGKPLLRREIFSNPSTGQHLLENWETRFLSYLEDKGIICRPGPKKGMNTRYQIIEPAEQEALRVLGVLLTDEQALGRLLFTKGDPLTKNGTGSEVDEPELEEPAPEDEAPPSEEPSPGDVLGLVAERLVLVLQAMVYMKETIEKVDKRGQLLEKKLDIIMKELGVSVKEEDT